MTDRVELVGTKIVLLLPLSQRKTYHNNLTEAGIASGMIFPTFIHVSAVIKKSVTIYCKMLMDNMFVIFVY